MESPEGSCRPPVLSCMLTIENLNECGSTKNSRTFKDAKLSLIRNEFRDLMLLVETKDRSLKYPTGNIKLHKRFLKEGKSTIYLKDRKINLMISNAPPNLLLALLKALSAKLAIDLTKEKVPLSERLKSNLPKNIEEVSPLMRKDYELIKKRRLACIDNRENTPGNSPLSSKKQKVGDSKSPSLKVARQLSCFALSQEQKNVLSAVQRGHNIFFTGGAGTGKSFLLKKIVGILPPDVTYVTASTGIAACQIGGTTLHSFAGIGSGEATLENCIKLASRNTVVQQWRRCKCLIIDEVSMVDGVFFEKLEAVARHVRNSDKPFGGIQLILCGDFLQLPPVTKKGEKKSFCFQTSAWFKCVAINLTLNQVRRQSDVDFIKTLQAIRFGRCSKVMETQLKETASNIVERDGIKATRLCTHKNDVEYINDAKLKELNTPSRIFVSVDSDVHLSDILDLRTPVARRLTLKVGAQVMLMKNLDISKGLVNGARGVVTAFKVGADGNPVVKFVCGVTMEVKPEKWVVKGNGGILVTRYQIPLKLAWAFSIHKSQGMTLDCVEMALSKVFEPGQAYVALSRARSLQSIRVLDFTQSCIRAHPEVLNFYNNLQECNFS